jgi:hypothetical protein
MSGSPQLERNFDPRRLFLVDLDGDGCADMVYVDFDRVHFWLNQSGNGWSERQTTYGTPPVSDLTNLQFADFYGTGTATLVWSYDYALQPDRNYKLLDFCGGVKPYLLTRMDNNLGATTRVEYAPSTKFYLEDKAAGLDWPTTLPFPVQVVAKTEVIDVISKTKLVTTYRYHRGYYDGREREFRGFGRVDQFDTEVFEAFAGPGLHGDPRAFANRERAFHVPPVETRTWFHTGVFFDEDRVDALDRPLDYKALHEAYRKEYSVAAQFGAHPQAGRFDEPAFALLPASAPPGHEAFRALRGAVLCTEVYSREPTLQAQHLYLVTESRYQVKELQPARDNAQAVYLFTLAERLSYHYERNPADPRVGHEITLRVDEFGAVTDRVQIGYPRREPQRLDRFPEQAELKILYTHIDVINRADDPLCYYVGLPCQTRSYEISGLSWSWGQPRLTAGGSTRSWIRSGPGQLAALRLGAPRWPFPSRAAHRRLVAHLLPPQRCRGHAGHRPADAGTWPGRAVGSRPGRYAGAALRKLPGHL